MKKFYLKYIQKHLVYFMNSWVGVILSIIIVLYILNNIGKIISFFLKPILNL